MFGEVFKMLLARATFLISPYFSPRFQSEWLAGVKFQYSVFFKHKQFKACMCQSGQNLLSYIYAFTECKIHFSPDDKNKNSQHRHSKTSSSLKILAQSVESSNSSHSHETTQIIFVPCPVSLRMLQHISDLCDISLEAPLLLYQEKQVWIKVLQERNSALQFQSPATMKSNCKVQ